MYSSNGVMSAIFSLSGPARSRCESIFIRYVVWETTGFAQVSSVETTVYLSRAEKSRVERHELRQLELTTETGT